VGRRWALSPSDDEVPKPQLPAPYIQLRCPRGIFEAYQISREPWRSRSASALITKYSAHELAFYSLATTSVKEFFDCPIVTGRVSSHAGRKRAISTADSLHYWRKCMVPVARRTLASRVMAINEMVRRRLA